MTTKTLLDFPPGATLWVHGFCPGIAAEEHSHLLAWGLSPGTELHLITHQPVTRLLVEHAELAIEASVARQVLATADKAA